LLTDLCSVTLNLHDSDRARFLDEVFRRRFSRENRLKGRTLCDILGGFEKSWAELARQIRKEPDPPSQREPGNAVEAVPAGAVLYYGREVLLNMWSGDTRDMIRIGLALLRQISENGTGVLELPIRRDVQNKVFRDRGGEFLHLLEACTRTAPKSGEALPAHITSWGKHLVKIAEGFKEIALHELRAVEAGRTGRSAEPKQAFRIEIVDSFSPSGIEKELYEDLVRYGVFLRDDRGKSIRGAVIPRLYLRRLLIPYFTLTFSKIDNVALKAADFNRLLLKPEEFARAWKRKRPDVGQKEMFE